MVGYIQVSHSMGIARSKYLFRRALEKDMDFGISPAIFKNLSIENGVNHMRSFLSSNLVVVRPYICSWLFGGPSLSTEWQSRFSRSQGTCSTFFNFRVLSPSQVLFFFFSKPTRILLQTTSCLSHPRKWTRHRDCRRYMSMSQTRDLSCDPWEGHRNLLYCIVEVDRKHSLVDEWSFFFLLLELSGIDAKASFIFIRCSEQ